MKLRARLALTLGLATIALLVLMGWGQSVLHTRLRTEALADAAVHRMESGGRERCERAPASWPTWQGRRGGPPRRGEPGRQFRRGPRFFAYDASLQSRNPRAPPFPVELAHRLEGKEVASTRSRDGHRTQVAIRMPWKDGPCAVLLVRARGRPLWFSGAILAPAGLASVAVFIVALLAAGPVVRRVRHLTEQVQRFTHGANDPIDVRGNDEVTELAAAFESTRQTIEAQIRSLQERESALRNYIANTTHDVMVPLSVLQGHLVSLQQRIEAGVTLTPEAIVPTLEEAHYLGSLLHNLNASARLESQKGLSNDDEIDLGRLVERVADRHRPIARRRKIALETAIPEGRVVFRGDLTLLEQALGNVVQNAIRYNRAEGHVAVVLEGKDARWSLRVIDDGPGIAEEDRARVLEPSFRGSEARTRHPHGMGLGLHIASDVAKRHGLRLELLETEGGGLTVCLSPSAAAAQPRRT